jgi:glycogen debranching enzyme
MKKRLILLLVVLILSILLFQIQETKEKTEPLLLDDLCIRVDRESREVAYTNKQAGVFYTESAAAHRSGWQGWRIMSYEMLEDFRFVLGDKELTRGAIFSAQVYPDRLIRRYPTGIPETVTMLDSLDAIVVELRHLGATRVSFYPLFSDLRQREDAIVKWRDGVLLIARKSHLIRTSNENYPVWIGAIPLSGSHVVDAKTFSAGFAPSGFQTEKPVPELVVALVAGDTEDRTVALAKYVAEQYSVLQKNRKRRMESVLTKAFLHTNNQRFDKAFHWALLSMDALEMNQVKRGIFAGLPWFDTYWGRDTYISLPGATLVTGKFEEAKEILRSFAEWQQTDPRSTDYGRIPNLVTTTSMSYNTTDGTPRFVIALKTYVDYTGDVVFARSVYPVVTRSIEGALKYHTDNDMMLTHGEAETWMDAVGPDGPWSPRGNRANDIQELWMRQLESGSELAKLVGDTIAEKQWRGVLVKVQTSFERLFVDRNNKLLYDHINSDNRADVQLRPNQLFAYEAIPDSLIRYAMFKTVTERLVYPYGVASLSQDDENFHPYHQYPPYYVKDAAYHNGVVWTWLCGKWIDIAAQQYFAPNLAYKVTENMVHQILDRGAVGTVSELLDAAPRPAQTEPECSGTFSQEWSLAEFVRVVYQSYLGISVDVPNGEISITPALPDQLKDVETVIHYASSKLNLHIERENDGADIRITTPRDFSGCHMELHWRMRDGYSHRIDFAVSQDASISIEIEKNKVTVKNHGKLFDVITARTPDRTILPDAERITLARPVVRKDLKSLRGPDHRLLNNDEIKQKSNREQSVIHVADPTGDDKGPGRYTYPTTTNLKPGSLDLVNFEVRKSDKNTRFILTFKNLSNPGWHPEYGFQLTYTAIALHRVGTTEKEGRHVGQNSQMIVPGNFSFDRIIYVGGGLRVCDGTGKILAEYLPVPGGEKNPLGNILTRTVEFTLPVELIGSPQQGWRYVVCVGAQDDHGGAGIGEFRSVEREAREWVGGGKRNPGDSNVYDVLFVNGQ